MFIATCGGSVAGSRLNETPDKQSRAEQSSRRAAEDDPVLLSVVSVRDMCNVFTLMVSLPAKKQVNSRPFISASAGAIGEKSSENLFGLVGIYNLAAVCTQTVCVLAGESAYEISVGYRRDDVRIVVTVETTRPLPSVKRKKKVPF